MKIFKEKVERRQVGTTCDMCGKECGGWEAYGWIYSHGDGDSTTCEFCEDCYNKVVKAIEDMGGKFHPVELS